MTPPMYSWVCPCGGETTEYYPTPISPTKEKKACPKCGKRMAYEFGLPMVITNSMWLDSKGRPSDPVARFEATQKKQADYKKKYRIMDRQRERKEREAGEKRLKDNPGSKRIQVG